MIARLVVEHFSRLKQLRQRCICCSELTGSSEQICTSCASLFTALTPGCRICAEPVPAAHVTICGHCLNHPPAYDRLISPLLYAEPLPQLIAQFKYRGHLYLAKPLSQLMLKACIQADMRNASMIVPVPLHPKRLRERGFNQALELARYLEKPLQIKCRKDVVQRIRNNRPQQGMNAKQRRINVKQSFAVNQPLAGERVLIVDDVVTTGTTVNELAKTLKKAGATSVSVLALARATLDR